MSKQTSEHFGTRIRRAREAAGLSRIGLAYKAGVDLRTIARIESGEVRHPHQATVAMIEQALAGTREATAA